MTKVVMLIALLSVCGCAQTLAYPQGEVISNSHGNLIRSNQRPAPPETPDHLVIK